MDNREWLFLLETILRAVVSYLAMVALCQAGDPVLGVIVLILCLRRYE